MKPVSKKTKGKTTTGAKKTVKKTKPAAKPGFGFGGAMGGPFGSAKKGGKPTTFANAMESMNNLMGDLELIDKKDSNDFLNDPEGKVKLLNCIANNDYPKFEMIL